MEIDQSEEMRILCVHAHFDDFEFVASGTFQLWQRRPGVRARVMVCTDGRAGHHFRTREETGRIRLAEQQESARMGGYELEQLRYPDGTLPREACLQVTTPLLAGLWKSIRAFEPDYLFCPPVPGDGQAGIHNDHVAVADAVRRIAYMINVPHAFTMEYPVDETQSEPCKVPVILNVHDSYMGGANAFDLAVDVEEVFLRICEMSYCHQSQITEWLPWVGRHSMTAPKTRAEWEEILRARFERKNRELNLPLGRAHEVFSVTAWGRVPSLEEIARDIPGLRRELSAWDELRGKLERWGSAG